MNAFFTVDNCPEPVEVPSPDKRNVKHSDDNDEGDDEDNMFSTIMFKPGGPMSVLRSSAKGRPKIWVHYISAEEIDWDYTSLSDGR